MSNRKNFEELSGSGPAADAPSDPSAFFDIGDVVSIEREEAVRMKALLEVSRRMNATLDEEELLPFMMDRVVELMEADFGHLVLLRLQPDGSFNPGSEKVPWEVKVSVARGQKTGQPSPPSNTLVRTVLEHRQPMRLDNALTDALLKDSPSVNELGLGSVMAVPLITRDRLIGVLSVENRGKFARFNQEHLDFLQIFGHQAAVAIENARLYRSLRDAQTQLSRAHRALRLEVDESYQALRHERQRVKTLESEVHHLDKMAALGQMVSGLAHELNNPMTGALGFAQMLAMSANLNDKQRQMVKHITTEISRCAELTRNLLSFSRKARSAQRASVELNRLVAEAVDFRRYQMEVNNVQIVETYDPGIGTVLVDAHQLKGVILNIINNAHDAIKEHGSQGRILVVTAVADDGRAMIQVTDDGGGIREPEKIFDPFYTTKEVGKGTGLGMSVAFGVVRSHGGSIAAENVAGGARITIQIPREETPAAVIEEVKAPEPAPSVQEGRILVVDDEAVIRELCQALLEGEGFQVDLAEDGGEAKRRLEKSRYDLVITDIRMPGEISGVDLYRWMKQEQPECCHRVVFITGDLLSQNLREALGEVGQRLLTKPFEVSALLEVVHHTLKQGEPTPAP